MLENHNRHKLPTAAEPGRADPDRGPGNNVLCSHRAVYSRRTPGRNVSDAGSRNCDLALSPPPNLIIRAPQASVCLFCQRQVTSLQRGPGPRPMPDHVAGRPGRRRGGCPFGNCEMVDSQRLWCCSVTPATAQPVSNPLACPHPCLIRDRATRRSASESRGAH